VWKPEPRAVLSILNLELMAMGFKVMLSAIVRGSRNRRYPRQTPRPPDCAKALTEIHVPEEPMSRALAVGYKGSLGCLNVSSKWFVWTDHDRGLM